MYKKPNRRHTIIDGFQVCILVNVLHPTPAALTLLVNTTDSKGNQNVSDTKIFCHCLKILHSCRYLFIEITFRVIPQETSTMQHSHKASPRLQHARKLDEQTPISFFGYSRITSPEAIKGRSLLSSPLADASLKVSMTVTE